MPAARLARSAIRDRVRAVIASRGEAISGAARRVRTGLVGAGIGASLSPALHEAEGAALGLSYKYIPIDLDVLGLGTEALPDILEAASSAGFAGLNITHPCKQAVMPLLSQLSGGAQAVGAVNTVVFSGGQTLGHNTDWLGFADSFRSEMSGASLDTVVLLGAGGAGAAVAQALLTLGAGRLLLVDIDASRRAKLCAAVRARWGTERIAEAVDIERAVGAASGLVNATPVGMAKYPGQPIATTLLHPGLWVADVVYFPLRTELLIAARHAGCRTLGGGGMVVSQAAEAIRLFTGKAPDAARMRAHFEMLTVGQG